MKVSDEDLRDMVTPAGFVDVFLRHTNQKEKLSDTFWRINGAYRERYGRDRYSDYGSFATVRGRKKK